MTAMYLEKSKSVLEEIAARLGPAKRNGSDGVMVKCPAHDDKNPSLAVSVRDGRLLVNCFAGCSQTAVIEALRSQGLWPWGISGNCRASPYQQNTGNKTNPPFNVRVWEEASPATNGCKYLQAKCVKSHGLRYHQNALLVPVMDIIGYIHGVQRLWPDGGKRFVPGTDKAGHFFQIGTPRHNTILIVEGYATGASLHEITGCAVIVAFDCGNLLPVAEVLRAAYPESQLIVCADDDYTKPGNPGVTAATEAVRAVAGLLAIPRFAKVRGSNDTDFNDLSRLEGAESVLSCIAAARVIA